MQGDQFNQGQQNNDLFRRPTMILAQCTIASEKYPEAGTN